MPIISAPPDSSQRKHVLVSEQNLQLWRLLNAEEVAAAALFDQRAPLLTILAEADYPPPSSPACAS
ncbi:hypothetical protein AB0B25_30515 [Nocardia sp. NPDC049190]|uniref:hypothetical protein n=1 Tax=Nocardia sp. NPDC049190 TaxID=3155650 RepID=UPI0033CF7125